MIRINCTSFGRDGTCLHQAAPRRLFGPALCIVVAESHPTRDPRIPHGCQKTSLAPTAPRRGRRPDGIGNVSTSTRPARCGPFSLRRQRTPTVLALPRVREHQLSTVWALDVRAGLRGDHPRRSALRTLLRVAAPAPNRIDDPRHDVAQVEHQLDPPATLGLWVGEVSAAPHAVILQRASRILHAGRAEILVADLLQARCHSRN